MLHNQVVTEVTKDRSPVFTPDDEPYLGRTLVHAFDLVILATLEANGVIAPASHGGNLTRYQQAACQLVPQGISIALSIRELIRQGYLFGALILTRPLIERAAVLMHLHENPGDLAIWERGWRHNEAPSLARMLEGLDANTGPNKVPGIGKLITGKHNSITHGKPDSAEYSIIAVGDGRFGHGVSKMTNNPALCDEICGEAVPWLSVILSMMCVAFPNAGIQPPAPPSEERRWADPTGRLAARKELT